MVYTLVVLSIALIFYLGLLMVGVAEPWSIPFYVLIFLYREWVIWAAYAFVQKLASDSISLLIPTPTSSGGGRVVYKL